MATNKLLDILNGNSGNNQAQSTGTVPIGRSIDSQQEAWNQALKSQPSTFKTWNPEPEVKSVVKNNNALLDILQTNSAKKEAKAESDETEFANRYFREQMSGKSYKDIITGGGTWNGVKFEDSPYTKWVRENYGKENGDYSMQEADEEEEKKPETKQTEPADNSFYTDTMRAIDEAAKDNTAEYGLGNINLNDRPVIQNEDGTISTVDSTSFNIGGEEVLIPTVIQENGEWKHVSPEEALRHYEETGEYLGKFDTPEEADAYAQQLHEDQERIYGGKNPFNFLDWIKNTAVGAVQGTASSLAGAQRLLFESGQKARTAQYEEDREQLQADYDKALAAYDEDKKNGVSEADLQADLNTIESIKRELDAYGSVVDEGVQEEATKATSELANELQEESNKSIEYAKAAAGDSWLGNFATDIAVNALQMAGDAAMNIVAPGTSLATMGLRTFGSAAQEAEAEGATLGQQFGYASVKGGIEVATELMFDGLAGIYGKGGADEIVEEVIRKLSSNDTGRTALRLMFGGIGEAIEEGVSGVADPLAKSIYKGIESIPKSYNKEMAADVLYDMLVGFAMGEGGSAINIATGGNSKANAELRAADAAEAEEKGNTNKRSRVETALDTAGENPLIQQEDSQMAEVSSTAPQTAPQESATTSNPTKAAQLETELDKATPAETTATTAPTTEESAQGNTGKRARLETELDKAETNDESTSVNTDPQDHTPQEQAVIDEYQASTDDSLKSFSENTRKTENKSLSNPLIDEISKKAAPEREITPEMEAEERTVNETVTEKESNEIDKTLKKASTERDTAREKAESKPTEGKETPSQRIRKLLTDNEKLLAKDRTRLENENKILRDRVQELARQTKKTDVQTADKADVRKAARTLVAQEESSADTTDVAEKLQSLADYIIQNDGETIDYSEVENMAGDIADTILEGSTVEIDSASRETAESVRDYLKTTSLRINESIKSDVSADFSDFAKQYKGKIKFSDSGLEIDSAYKELAEMFPGFFPEDITHPADQLIQIADVLSEAEPQLVSRYEAEGVYDQVYAELTQQVIDTVLSDAIGQTAPTFADKAESRYNAMRSDYEQRMKDLRQQKNERMKELRQQAAESKREAVAKEKAAKWKKVKSVQQYYRDIIDRSNAKRKNAKTRTKIKKGIKDIQNRLTKPKEGHYVPQELVNAAVDLLQSIDLTSGSETSQVRADRLAAEYRRFAADPDFGSIMTDEAMQARLDQLAEYVGGTRLIDMDTAQLEAVYQVVNELADNIDKAVKIKIKGEERSAFETSDKMRTEVEEAKAWGKSELANSVIGAYSGAALRPTTYLERLGGMKKNSAWSEIAEMLNEGQRKATEETVKGYQKFADLVNDPQSNTFRDEKSLGKDAEGNDITVSRGMMVSLYLHLLNENNARHIKYGGLTIPGISDYYKGKNDGGLGTSKTRALGISPELARLQYEYKQIAQEYQTIDAEETKDAAWQDRIDDVVARLDEKAAEIDAVNEKGGDYIEQLRNRIESELTDYEKSWVQMWQEFSAERQNALNDTTLDVYGFKKALEENYFKIVTDPNFRNASFESISRDMSLENSGFMKNRVTSTNPIILLDIADVITRYNDESAKYIGLMPAIRNFEKVYNKSRAGYEASLRDSLEKKFGKSSTTYIENLIADLTGARKDSNDAVSVVTARLRSNLAQSVLSLNPRVALSQSASYINAAAELGYEPLLKSFGMGKNAAFNSDVMNLITKYSPLEYYRSIGNATVDIGDIKNDARVQNRIMKKFDFLMNWISTVDTATVGQLWYASEYFVQQNSNLEVGTDEYYQEVAKKFNRVVERTQPNYTTMQRPGALRTTNEIAKSLTMFMTQRLQNFNILYEAAERYAKYESDYRDSANDVTLDDVRQARSELGVAVTSQIGSAATLVAMKAVVDAALRNLKKYRDDDDRFTPESVSLRLLDMFTDTMLGTFLGGSEIYSFAKSLALGENYYGVSLNGVDTFTGLLKDITDAVNASDSARAKKWQSVAIDISEMFGVPADNASDIINAIIGHTQDIINGDFGEFVAGTDFKTAPNTVRDSNGNTYLLNSQEQKTYSDRFLAARDSYLADLQKSKYYDMLTDEQRQDAEKELISIAKDTAKSGYFSDNGIDYSSDVQSLLSGKDAPGTSNDRTALNSKNVADYVAFKTGFDDAVNGRDYSMIDEYLKSYNKLNANTKTVLLERASELKNLEEYKDIGIGAQSYFTVKDSVKAAQETLDKSSNQGSDVKMLGLVNARIPESQKGKIIDGIDGFVSQAMKNSYDVLSGYGFNTKQVYEFFSEADYRVNKQTGEVVTSGKGQLDAAEAAYGISKLPGLNDKQRSEIFNAMKGLMSNYYNDWKDYTYSSEINYINTRSKYSYGRGGSVSGSSVGGSGSSSSGNNQLLDILRGSSSGSISSSSSSNSNTLLDILRAG